MANREYVEGTDPAIYIGNRIFYLSDGTRSPTRTWAAEYCVEGRQRAKSLGTRSRAHAIRQAHALCQRLISGTERNWRIIGIRQVKDDYLNVLTNRGRVEKTLVKYRYVLAEFSEWWEGRGGGRASKFTERDLWEYRSWLERKGKGPHSISDRLLLVKQLFKWAATKGQLLPTNPIADTSIAEPPPTRQPCFTPDQVRLLLERADSHLRPIFAAMAYTGMRIGEIVALRWQDVLFDHGAAGFIHVQLGGSNGTTKGKRSRLIPIHPELRPILEALPRTSDLVFTRRPSRRHPQLGKPLHDRTLLVAIKQLCKDCGFANWQKYKLHTFRHAFASMCARSQVSVKYALNWMGHKSSDILDMYITMYDDTADMAMQTISYARPANSVPTAVVDTKSGQIGPVTDESLRATA